MDDTIKVAIIGAVATIAAALITSLVKARRASAYVEKGKIEETPAIEETPVIDPPGAAIGLVTHDKPKRITNLTHRQICDAIDAVLPFHQGKIRDDFIGMTVSWKTTLIGIDHYNDADRVSVVGNIPEGDGCLFCRARRADCDGFILAKEGAPFSVTGEIKLISRNEAELIDCQFTVVSSDVASHGAGKIPTHQEQNLKMFTAMVDNLKSQSTYSVGDMARDYFRRLQPINPLSELIRCSNKMVSEANLNWFCDEFERHGYAPPLKDFKSVLANNFHWLPVLQEARHRPREIKTQAEFLDFLATEWSQKEIWKQAMERKNSASPKLSPEMAIHSASWGIEDKYRDVTKIVREHLLDNKIQMACEVDILGEPRPGISKILKIDYSFLGKRTQKIFKEHEVISQQDLKGNE